MEEFQRFWEAYPRKKSKGVAFKAWNETAAIRPPIDALLKAVFVLRASDDWHREGGKWTPYPASWLRAWGWEDVAEIELDAVDDGKAWHETVHGITDMGKSLGLEWQERLESFQAFAKRVRHAVTEKVTPIRKDMAA